MIRKSFVIESVKIGSTQTIYPDAIIIATSVVSVTVRDDAQYSQLELRLGTCNGLHETFWKFTRADECEDYFQNYVGFRICINAERFIKIDGALVVESVHSVQLIGIASSTDDDDFGLVPKRDLIDLAPGLYRRRFTK